MACNDVNKPSGGGAGIELGLSAPTVATVKGSQQGPTGLPFGVEESHSTVMVLILGNPQWPGKSLLCLFTLVLLNEK